jgi:hypothetical protein
MCGGQHVLQHAGTVLRHAASGSEVQKAPLNAWCPAHRLDALGKSSLVILAHCLFGTPVVLVTDVSQQHISKGGQHTGHGVVMLDQTWALHTVGSACLVQERHTARTENEL